MDMSDQCVGDVAGENLMLVDTLPRFVSQTQWPLESYPATRRRKMRLRGVLKVLKRTGVEFLARGGEVLFIFVTNLVVAGISWITEYLIVKRSWVK